ncbi:dihydrofolate reductase family protein [Actinomadura adrarensis]|uniref:Dihydrofolate reductase family protein n=1 Tax=Actinomadura adrarensis TaxID=1819600 RepID=A0ABW3CPW4_9ACTN
MSKVFFSVTVSLDGYMAPEWRSDDQWMSQWTRLQDYMFHQRFIRNNLKFGGAADGETGDDNRIQEETFQRTGVTIMGRRMFDLGERSWPEDAPFHTPVFVLTHQERKSWERPGGTVFHFVNDGYESALRQAREVAGDRDIRIGGGVNTVQQYLNAGLVDEFHLAVAPVLLGSGLRLFDGVDPASIGLELQEALKTPRVHHLRYTVKAATPAAT